MASEEPLDAVLAVELPPRRALLLPMLAVFQGYACYVSLQHDLKSRMGADGSHVFTQAAVFMHYGKLVMRVGHDIVCACLSSKMRVTLAMIMVMLGLLVPVVFVYGLGMTWMGFAFIHFALLGVGVGIFEGVYLSVVAPLGPATRFWVVLGAPAGFATVNIFGMLATSAGLPPVALYAYSVVCLPLGLAVFLRLGPEAPAEGRRPANFGVALKHGRAWLPCMLPIFLAKFVGSFVMDNTPGWYYVFNDPAKVPLWGPTSTQFVNHDLYFAAIGVMVFLGDAISRRVPMMVGATTGRVQTFLLVVSVLTSALGFYLESYASAALTLLAGFLAFWGNGLNYAVGAAFIKESKEIPDEYERAVYSMWCMVGDVAGVLGASVIDIVNHIFCPRAYAHECLSAAASLY